MCSLKFALSHWRQFQTATHPEGVSVAELRLLGHRPGSPSATQFRDSSRTIQPDTAKNKLPLLRLGDKTRGRFGQRPVQAAVVACQEPPKGNEA
ncbi:hypothetical protein N7449_003848 [Penicillium cf. viridicatum]|uniref:Uncharacterized protein n=1 Tax=Penicillium cf. viridicatum TaxID=2972119 RepID=A0A9W9MY37_9EURO|nr:hypothetical protein N7449_003848 [Penicillium cf. viridicatum]